jgi:hypothetical protein
MEILTIFIDPVVEPAQAPKNVKIKNNIIEAFGMSE